MKVTVVRKNRTVKTRKTEQNPFYQLSVGYEKLW